MVVYRTEVSVEKRRQGSKRVFCDQGSVCQLFGAHQYPVAVFFAEIIVKGADVNGVADQVKTVVRAGCLVYDFEFGRQAVLHAVVMNDKAETAVSVLNVDMVGLVLA